MVVVAALDFAAQRWQQRRDSLTMDSVAHLCMWYIDQPLVHHNKSGTPLTEEKTDE